MSFLTQSLLKSNCYFYPMLRACYSEGNTYTHTHTRIHIYMHMYEYIYTCLQTHTHAFIQGVLLPDC